jgi:hypothetical protein
MTDPQIVYSTRWIAVVLVTVFFVARRVIQVDREEARWL